MTPFLLRIESDTVRVVTLWARTLARAVEKARRENPGAVVTVIGG